MLDGPLAGTARPHPDRRVRVDEHVVAQVRCGRIEPEIGAGRWYAPHVAGLGEGGGPRRRGPYDVIGIEGPVADADTTYRPVFQCNTGGMCAVLDRDFAFGESLCERCLLYTSPSPRDRTRSRM